MFALGGSAAAAVVATVVTVVTVVASVGSCSPASNPPVAGPPSAGPAATSVVPGTTSGSVQVNVPIYYIGSTKQGPLLFREYHVSQAADSSTAARLTVALRSMLDGRTAYDADYSSGWPASASVRSVSVAGGVATVDLGGATVNGYDPAGNRAALQQLIWTATAYSGASGVKLLFDGQPRATLWKVALPVVGVLHRAPAVDALAPVWVIDPQATSSQAKSFTVNLAGIVFEGTVNVQIKNAAGKVVLHRVVQLTVGAPAQGTASLNVTLPADAYTIEAYEVSMKDGSVAALDGHPFTVG